MNIAGLINDQPRGEQARELARLIEQRRYLAVRVGEIESQRDGARREASERSRELTALEQRRAGGDDVDTQVARVEKALAKAKALADAPWSERVAGAQAAVRAAEDAIRLHTTAHFDALAAELSEDAERAAQAVDEAVRGVITTYTERQRIASRFESLIAAAVGRSEPGLIAYSKAEQLASDADAFLMRGGEPAPILRRDPRKPLAGVGVDLPGDAVESWS